MNALINMHKFCGMCVRVLMHKYINFSKYTICIMYNNWKLHTDNEINAFIDELLDIDFTTLTLMYFDVNVIKSDQTSKNITLDLIKS